MVLVQLQVLMGVAECAKSSVSRSRTRNRQGQDIDMDKVCMSITDSKHFSQA